MTPPTAFVASPPPALGTPVQAVPVVPRGPPLWKVHELPVPIRTFPLPSFYPNNPLSLFHVAYAWVRQVLAPPPCEPSVVFEGIWSPKTRSVKVTDPKSMRGLWEQGFYGKGHLSRSEPNWLKRELARRGAQNGHVAEVFTNKRREERFQMKWERARKEQETIQRTRYEEARIAPVGPAQLLALPNSQRDLDLVIYGAPNGSAVKPSVNGTPPIFEARGDLADGKPAFPFPVLNGDAERPNTPESKSPSCNPAPDVTPPQKRRKSVRFSPKVESATFQLEDPPSPSQAMVIANGNGKLPGGILTNGFTQLSGEPDSLDLQSPSSEQELLPEPESPDEIVDKEHLQLTLEETFWLTFGLGVLRVKDETTEAHLSVEELFQLCRGLSYFPRRTTDLRADDPFLIHYVVYHHFRSLGWVARPGIKFGCDWLLYHRGPAFSHAEFAIVVLPSYSDPYWETHDHEEPDKSWHWLHLVNRVQATALKTLVLVYVDVPPPTDGATDIPSLLKRYTIREFIVKRWQINRNRD
jgi:tRNA-splicing endonuclease subunit Sen2